MAIISTKILLFTWTSTGHSSSSVSSGVTIQPGGQVGPGVEGILTGEIVGRSVSAGMIVFSFPNVGVFPGVAGAVGFKVGRRDVGIGVGILLGISESDGKDDGWTNSEGALETVGERVVGRREGEIVGVDVLTTGKGVGASKGACVGGMN